MRLHFGLETAATIDSVGWPSGITERFENIAVDSIHSLQEGSGAPVLQPAPPS
jgi:hypothetical protein